MITLKKILGRLNFLKTRCEECLNNCIKIEAFHKACLYQEDIHILKLIELEMKYIFEEECFEEKNQKNIVNLSGFRSPGFQDWMEKLPTQLDIGKKVKILKGPRAGEIGIVTNHWQNLDDCSGGYGNHLYQLEGDEKKYGVQNNIKGINVKDCEIIS